MPLFVPPAPKPAAHASLTAAPLPPKAILWIGAQTPPRLILLKAKVIENIQEGFLPTRATNTGLPTTLGGSAVVPDHQREISAAKTNGELSVSTVSTGVVQQSIMAKILGSASNAERPQARRLSFPPYLLCLPPWLMPQVFLS
jgi:hypothetical protein